MSKVAALRRAIFSRRTLAYVSGGTLVAAGGGYWYLNSGPTYPPSTKETRRPPPPWTPPSRQHMLDALKASDVKDGDAYPQEFDLLIVGGGATGAGVAVDAASRGLKVALVERDDFSSGESRLLYTGLSRLFLCTRGCFPKAVVVVCSHSCTLRPLWVSTGQLISGGEGVAILPLTGIFRSCFSLFDWFYVHTAS